jgi:histidine triad (HIT) family protein
MTDATDAPGLTDAARTADAAGAGSIRRDPGCLFCRIVAGEIPSTRVHEDDLCIGIRDIAPRAPTHVLFIPRRHIASSLELTDADGPLLGRMFAAAADLARSLGIADDGFRQVFNTGRFGGQTVDHLHLHLLGGRSFEWPPG